MTQIQDFEVLEVTPVAEANDVAPGKRRKALTVVVVAVTVALMAIGVYQFLEKRGDDARIRDRGAALAAARQGVVNLTTVSQKTAKQDIDRLLAGSTAEFRDQFAAQAEAFQKALQQAKVNSVGEAVEAGLVSLENDTAVALVAAHATVKNKSAPKGEPRNYRLKITLKKQDEDWRISGLEFVA